MLPDISIFGSDFDFLGASVKADAASLTFHKSLELA
jgi:hypothetical protein